MNSWIYPSWHETLIWQEHLCHDISHQVFTIWISSRGFLFTKTCFCVFETDINHRISVKELKSQTFPSSETCIHESIHLHHYGHEDDFDFNAEELVAIQNQFLLKTRGLEGEHFSWVQRFGVRAPYNYWLFRLLNQQNNCQGNETYVASTEVAV